MSSLQSALPNSSIPTSYVDGVIQSWFPQNPFTSYVPGEVSFDPPIGISFPNGHHLQKNNSTFHYVFFLTLVYLAGSLGFIGQAPSNQIPYVLFVHVSLSFFPI